MIFPLLGTFLPPLLHIQLLPILHDMPEMLPPRVKFASSLPCFFSRTYYNLHFFIDLDCLFSETEHKLCGNDHIELVHHDILIV